MAENAGGGPWGPSQYICHNVTAGLQGHPEEAATSQGGHALTPVNVATPVASEGPLSPLRLFCCPFLFAPLGLAGLRPGSSSLPSTCVPFLAASTPFACCWLSETAFNPLLSSRASRVSYVTSPLGYVTTPSLGVILQFSLPSVVPSNPPESLSVLSPKQIYSPLRPTSPSPFQLGDCRLLPWLRLTDHWTLLQTILYS